MILLALWTYYEGTESTKTQNNRQRLDRFGGDDPSTWAKKTVFHVKYQWKLHFFTCTVWRVAHMRIFTTVWFMVYHHKNAKNMSIDERNTKHKMKWKKVNREKRKKKHPGCPNEWKSIQCARTCMYIYHVYEYTNGMHTLTVYISHTEHVVGPLSLTLSLSLSFKHTHTQSVWFARSISLIHSRTHLLTIIKSN